MEERWGFLVPWCQVLQKKIEYVLPEHEVELWDIQSRFLRVQIPQRRENHRGYEEFHFTQEDELNFQIRFRNVQETLALLAAVAHVDYNAWRYLLEKHCDVNFGAEGEERYEQEIPVWFRLIMDVEGRTSENSFDSDLVQFCGVKQCKNHSEEYWKTLDKIASLNENLKDGVDVKIPVQVVFKSSWNGSMKKLKDIWKGEDIIREQWTAYAQSPPKQSELLSCTFILEPMQVDLRVCPICPEMVDMIDQLVVNNVWFAQFFLLPSGDEDEDDEVAVKNSLVDS